MSFYISRSTSGKKNNYGGGGFLANKTMKKITAILGKSHNDFDHQLKDFLNEMCDAIDNIVIDRQRVLEYQNKIFLKQHAEVLQSPICDTCHQRADIMTVDISKGTYKSYCNVCLTK
jgi:hypothetical protein